MSVEHFVIYIFLFIMDCVHNFKVYCIIFNFNCSSNYTKGTIMDVGRSLINIVYSLTNPLFKLGYVNSLCKIMRVIFSNDM